MSSPSALVKVAELPNRGRALVAARPIKPGEIILSDSPLLIYPATFAAASASNSCSRCFRSIAPDTAVRCTSHCSASSAAASFCSPRCLASHTESICLAVSRLPASIASDLVSPAFFLLAAYDLCIHSPADFVRLLTLHGGPAADVDALALHDLMSSILPSRPSEFSVGLTSALISRDKANAFGLMEPFDGGDRRVRAYGIYPNASFFNHDCLPNACRFDYVDKSGDGNTDVIVRAIHEIPEGREVCLSYFPVTWRFAERQKRLLEEYGFRCECDRCIVEKDWSDDDEDEGKEEEDESMQEDEGDEAMENTEEVSDLDGDEDAKFPHAYFFVRYVCERDNCRGTMAPLPPSVDGKPTNVMECNVCGSLKTEDVTGQDGCETSNGIMQD